MIDRWVGERLELARKLAGLDQPTLAAALGVDREILQKFEDGTLRLPASTMILASELLQQRVAFFLSGLSRAGPVAPAAE